jgi:hypothetical protein
MRVSIIVTVEHVTASKVSNQGIKSMHGKYPILLLEMHGGNHRLPVTRNN